MSDIPRGKDGKPRKPRIAPPPRNTSTPLDFQRHALAKLLADPTKAVHIPAPPAEGIKQLRAPREMMKNVQGSSAGAGSGEFHVYKQSRRREYERLKIMDEEEEYDKRNSEAAQRQISYMDTAEAKTAKNRLKRQRKKDGRKGGNNKLGAGANSEEEEEITQETIADKKRKLGGGAMMKFKSAEERAEEGDGEVGEEEIETALEAEVKEAEVQAAVEAGIMVRDED